jgi:hypothetical protein
MAHLAHFKQYLEKINGFWIAALLLMVSGVEDSVLTAENIGTYGLDIEGNPIVRKLVEHWGVVPGLFYPKVVVFIVIVYTAHMMNKTRHTIRGEYLLYGATICWLCGALSNLLVK